jgi:signal transduction histidine kinase
VRADSAGISLLDGEVFRWEAVAGVCADARGGTMPRDQSPCGVCIERNSTQLMHLADRAFPALRAEPRFVEALLVPFHSHDQPVGTVWVVSHRTEKTFDSEDERIVRVLSGFAPAGWQMWKATEALEVENSRKDEFVATLGHELRNPLGVISSATAVLRHNVPDGAPALDVIAKQVRHVSHLIDDLLDVTLAKRGKLTLKRELVDLRAIVEESVVTSRMRFALRQHELLVDVGPDALIVDADVTRIGQAVTNLIENAVKYTPPHGRISVDVSRRDRQVRVDVRDNGSGIPADSLEAIFEPFVQLTTHHGATGGLGLGLALVRRVVELHGGTVSVASPGLHLGSCFTVQLPLHSGTAPRPEPR